MRCPEIKIPYETYQRLLNHLSIHAETDAWAKQLLAELQQLKQENVEDNWIAWLSHPCDQN